MNGSPLKLGSIQGTAGHRSALKKVADEKMLEAMKEGEKKRKADVPPTPPGGWKRLTDDDKKKMEEKFKKISRKDASEAKGMTKKLRDLTPAEIKSKKLDKNWKEKATKKSPAKKKGGREDGTETYMQRKVKDVKSKVRRAGEKVGEYAAGAKAYVKELTGDKYYKGKQSAGYATKDPSWEATKARQKYKDKKSGKEGMDYSVQNKKVDVEGMKTSMVSRYNKKKADARKKAAAEKKKKSDAAFMKEWNKTKKGGFRR